MKKYISWVLVVAVVLSCVGGMNVFATTGQDIVDDLNENYVGQYPYVLGTRGPESFDCSGLVYYIYKQYGVTLPHSTAYDYRPFGMVIEDVSQLQSGDILLFGSEESMNHVGIFDEDGGYIIHALNPGKGIVREPKLEVWIEEPSWNSYGNNQFRYAVRVFDDTDTFEADEEQELDSEIPWISDTEKLLQWTEMKDKYDVTTEELQKCLNYVMDVKLFVDGHYGIETYDAVKLFQEKYGLDVDGDAGPQTLGKMNEVIREMEKEEEKEDNNEEDDHNHRYIRLKYETMHPHRQYKECSCKAVRYTGKTREDEECDECYQPQVRVVKLQINSPEMYVDGAKTEVDPGRETSPMLKDGRTVVPIRAVAESFGARVIWNSSKKMVSIYTDDVTMRFLIDSTRAVVNDKEYTLDVAPEIVGDRTYMPLRFIAENMGLDVSWDNETQTITVEGEM